MRATTSGIPRSTSCRFCPTPSPGSPGTCCGSGTACFRQLEGDVDLAGCLVAGDLGANVRDQLFRGCAVVVFGLASLAAGLSQSGAELISARVVQGAAAAAMASQVLATFRAIFAGSERGKAFSIYGAMLGFASAVGLLLGGVLTEANLFGWSWRAVFFVNIPVAAGALIAGLRFVPETKDTGARRPDVPGAVLLAGSLVAIAYPLAVCGAGLALLVIPLVNVVLAAVPVQAAGGASGLFSTAQQLGGAIGVALLGTVFFGYLNGHSFEAAIVPAALGAGHGLVGRAIGRVPAGGMMI